MFKSINNNLPFPQKEDEIISFWKKNKIFERSVDERSEDNRFVFYDGPPFISGMPHYGHLLGSIAKDVIPRYQTMLGKRVERVWGWDAHGLTVENKVQERLGIKNRREIEQYGLKNFVDECYKYTSEISSEWDWYIDKIGRWVDLKNAYKTMDQSYMESVMWAFKQLYEKDLIYEGVRTSLFCPTCGTPVSNFEIAMDNSYKDMPDPAIIVKFKVTTKGKFLNAYILAWTTTPWTIPTNRALAVNKDEIYMLVESEGSYYVVAKPRLDVVFKDHQYKEVEDFKGEELVGLSYEPVFKVAKPNKNEFKVYHFDGMVTMDEGTGIVHSAPGYGEIDTEMGLHYKLNLMQLINDEGKFVEADSIGLEKWEENPFVGIYYKATDRLVIDDLDKRNLLFSEEEIVHRFPFHDRCDTPLLYKSQKSWFIKVSELKDLMIETNEDINWVPKHLKKGRFGKGIEQAPDWCISRNRFWATPMPVWESKDGDRIIIGSVKELEELSGVKVKDLHRPFIDEVLIKKNGKEYRRISEVLDCWMESGSMPFAQVHYPFENEKKFKDNFPGDYIIEYIAQTRAWFYVMHVMSNALFGKRSFNNVVTTGVMSGNDGRKMSKTFNNYTDPRKLLETIGGDALRLYLMGSPLMVGENANFDEVEIRNKSKNVLFPLWNSLKFFLIYAELHKWDSKKDFVDSTNPLDIWIKARLKESRNGFSKALDKYVIPNAVAYLEEFVTDLSTWFVRRSRTRFANNDKEALSTLYSVLKDASIAFAPMIPFITEGIYQELRNYNDPDSVHLELYPKKTKISKLEQEALDNMVIIRDIVALGQSARVDAKIKVKQPLEKIEVDTTIRLEDWMKLQIMEELNVKSVVENKINKVIFTNSIKTSQKSCVLLDINLSKELLEEGLIREIFRSIQTERKKAGLNIGQMAKCAYYTESKDLETIISQNKSEIMKKASLLSLDNKKVENSVYKFNDYELYLEILI